MIDYFKQLPEFSKILPHEIKETTQNILSANRKQLEQMLTENPTPSWNILQTVLDEMNERLSQYWALVGHLNAVVNSPELRENYSSCLPLISNYFTDLGQDERLYKAYLAISQTEHQWQQLDTAEKKDVTNNIRDFKLSGVALPTEQQQEFKKLNAELSELNNKFSDNVLDATMAWSKLINDKNLLTGIPDSALENAKELATEKQQEGWLFTLDFPSYHPLMTYCDNRELRQELYTAYVTRASDQGPHNLANDNSKLMNQILDIRQKLADLLEFDNYCDYSLATKMAKDYTEVFNFLSDLVTKSKPQAEQEFAEMVDYATKKLKIAEIQAWDIAYVTEKMQQEKYNISQEELRPWFPVNKVLSGFFSIAQKLFNISFSLEDNVDLWHKDVQCYKLSRGKQTIGYVYIDLYARENKRSGAWMDVCKNRWITTNKTQLPVAFLTCNFTPATTNKISQLTHDEVLTLFHEFGHCLHHLLTQVNTLAVAGISNVEWDAVELPSQFLENWCWQQEGLAIISSHFETGKALPQEKLDKLLASKNFQSAMMMIRQLEFSLFDFELHKNWQNKIEIQQLLDNIRNQVSVFIPPKFNKFQNSFSHIFAGGYAAGYYSYKWAEVLSADAFAKFEETSIFDSKTSKEFLTEILEKGGSEDASILFQNFRGRDPQIEPLLRHNGINY